MPFEPFTPPSIPIYLASFPTIGGIVIPFTTLMHTNGKAALGLVDDSRLALCLRDAVAGSAPES